LSAWIQKTKFLLILTVSSWLPSYIWSTKPHPSVIAVLTTLFYFQHGAIHISDNCSRDYIRDVKEVGRSVVLGGDGRADTPGHSAKYGTYSMVDLDDGVVVDIQLVQVQHYFN
jgi:hypothetical protein